MVARANKKALKDLAVISALALVAVALASYFEAFETFTAWSRRHESWELDEVVMVPVIFGLAFGVYSWRRWKDLDREVARRRKLEEQLAYRATHDHLTALPNRSLFMDRLESAVSGAARNGGCVAVLFLDLDDFKDINDSLGHEAGDHLLTTVARRIRACMRPKDTVARLGGDEFTVLIEDAAGLKDAVRVAKRISEKLEAPFSLNGREVRVTASIGIALGNRFEDGAGQLLRGADLAMYRAKDGGKARYEVFAAR